MQQKRRQTVHTNNLGAAEHEAGKPTFHAPINLFLFWVFNAVPWKIGWEGGKPKEKEATTSH